MVAANNDANSYQFLPDLDVEQNMSTFLTRPVPGTSEEKVAEVVKKAPLIQNKNFPLKTGNAIVREFRPIGPTASDHSESSLAAEAIVHDLALKAAPDDSAPGNMQIRDWRKVETHHRARGDLPGRLMFAISQANKELWLILSMIAIVGAMNYLLVSHQMLLGLYTLPTLYSAYQYGRRHATLTAFASVFLVGLVVHLRPDLFSGQAESLFVDGRWYGITVWGGILVITAYAMGTLYERSKRQMEELRSTYYGLLMILRQFISKDEYTENHCYRVSIYAAKIASHYGCKQQQIEDIRSAALLHDIGKLEISRQLLYKAASFTKEEYERIKRHADYAGSILEPLGGPLERIIPIIISHHEKFDGSGYHSDEAEQIPMESRIISVADVYDSLVSDRPYRKAMSPFEAKEIISKGSGTDFDPDVVRAFLKGFRNGEMEIPSVVV